MLKLFILLSLSFSAFAVEANRCKKNKEVCVAALFLAQIPLTKKRKRQLKKAKQYAEPEFKMKKGKIKIRYIGNKQRIMYVWDF